MFFERRTIMGASDRAESPLFTATEAAVLTRLPLKAVNNAIDKRAVILAAGRSRNGQGSRLLDLTGLMYLALERRLASRLQPALRREVFGALATARRTVVLEDGLVRIDLREPRRELAASLRDLRRARRMVHSDPARMGGQPMFRGTRLSPHRIAELLAQGEGAVSLMEGYPSLTAEMVRLAPVYAAAYPERGRPLAQPWAGQPPSRQIRRRLPPAAVT